MDPLADQTATDPESQIKLTARGRRVVVLSVDTKLNRCYTNTVGLFAYLSFFAALALSICSFTVPKSSPSLPHIQRSAVVIDVLFVVSTVVFLRDTDDGQKATNFIKSIFDLAKEGLHRHGIKLIQFMLVLTVLTVCVILAFPVTTPPEPSTVSLKNDHVV